MLCISVGTQAYSHDISFQEGKRKTFGWGLLHLSMIIPYDLCGGMSHRFLIIMLFTGHLWMRADLWFQRDKNSRRNFFIVIIPYIVFYTGLWSRWFWERNNFDVIYEERKTFVYDHSLRFVWQEVTQVYDHNACASPDEDKLKGGAEKTLFFEREKNSCLWSFPTICVAGGHTGFWS